MPEPAPHAPAATDAAEPSSLREAIDALRRLAARAEALDEATRAIAGVLDPDAVLQLIVDRVRDLVGTEYAALGTVDEEGQIDRFYTSGLSRAERERIGPLPRGRGLLGLIIEEGRSYLSPDIAADPHHVGFPPDHPPMHAFIGVPITVHGDSVGNLYLTNRRGGGPFTSADLQLVELFARHAGIAIDNARLHERIGRLAIVEERERIGRDLHDGIIQSIYAVALSLEEVAEIVADEPADARVRVDRAIESLDLTIRDIRNFIFGLRPELLEEAGLLGGLAALADEFRLNALIEVELDIAAADGVEPGARRTHELLAIVREALSNVARHARARRATIVVRAVPGGQQIVVADDGVGFDAAVAPASGHQGLRNMRERASALGAGLEIESQRGQGARIIVTMSSPDPGVPPDRQASGS
ncbi:MAG: GAF domain-containing sensor histidine kinase [Candidatus Limnocylindrales bacterium]